MRLSLRTLSGLICLILASRLCADLQDALVARAVLTDVVSTCVVKIDYAATAARPRIFATAFRLEDVLWLYAPEIGTRALGPAARAWPDSAALAARVQKLDPAVRRVTVYLHPVAPIVRQELLYLNNACVIAALHSLGEILNADDHITEAGLILMAFDSPESAGNTDFLVNHCVLAYRRDGRWWCLDPNQTLQPFLVKSVAVGAPPDPSLAALVLQGDYPLKSVHLLALSPRTLDLISSNVRWRSLAANK